MNTDRYLLRDASFRVLTILLCATLASNAKRGLMSSPVSRDGKHGVGSKQAYQRLNLTHVVSLG